MVSVMVLVVNIDVSRLGRLVIRDFCGLFRRLAELGDFMA